MEQPSKATRRSLGKPAAFSLQEEFRRALLPVAAAFEPWRAGGQGSRELAAGAHGCRQGPTLELPERHDPGRLEFAAANGIVSGVIRRYSVSAKVGECCRGGIAFPMETS